MAAGTTEAVRRALHRGLQRVYSRLFFVTLTLASLSQGVVTLWLLRQFGIFVSPVVAVPGLVGLAALNVALVGRARRRGFSVRGPGPVARLYAASALPCLFATLFLLGHGVLQGALALVPLSKRATGAVAAVAAGAGGNPGLPLSRFTEGVGVGFIFLVLGYGYTVGQWQVRRRRLRLPVRGYPAAWDGLRITHISDLHIGVNLTAQRLRGFVERVNAEKPDLICITGDIIDSATADLEGCLPILAGLEAPLGVYVVLGNHEHYAGGDVSVAILRRLTPFTVLRDERVTLTIRGEPLHIVGLDDRAVDWLRGVRHDPCLPQLLKDIPEGEPVLLLSHRADLFEQAAAAGIPLLLTGHTHGGQIAIPWWDGYTRSLATWRGRFDRGLFEHEGSLLYVNSGLGVSIEPIRLCSPREIATFVLDAAAPRPTSRPLPA